MPRHQWKLTYEAQDSRRVNSDRDRRRTHAAHRRIGARHRGRASFSGPRRGGSPGGAASVIVTSVAPRVVVRRAVAPRVIVATPVYVSRPRVVVRSVRVR